MGLSGRRMRGTSQQDFLSEIKVLSRRKHGASAPMALLHHELYAKNAVLPFSLSLPVIKASPASMEFPRNEQRSPSRPDISRQHLSRL
jgi:hypothetical protein